MYQTGRPDLAKTENPLFMKTPKIGDVIELDCGYDGMIDMQPCKVLRLYEATDLWNHAKVNLCAEVRQVGTDYVFQTTLKSLEKKP
jgi:hypothetical protein